MKKIYNKPMLAEMEIDIEAPIATSANKPFSDHLNPASGQFE